MERGHLNSKKPALKKKKKKGVSKGEYVFEVFVVE